MLGFVVEVPDVVHHGDAGNIGVADNPLRFVLRQGQREGWAALSRLWLILG